MPYINQNPPMPSRPEPMRRPDAKVPPKTQPDKKAPSGHQKPGYKNTALFHGKDVSTYDINRALRKEEYENRWNQDSSTKLNHEGFEELKKIIEKPKYGATISDDELRLAKKELENTIKRDKLNPFKPEDWKKIVATKKEINFLDKKLREGK